MTLGDILARFDDEAFAAETILGLGDLALVAALQKLAESSGMSLGAFAAGAVRRYAAAASDEEWITLMGALSRAEDPGAVCLKRALSFAATSPLAVNGSGAPNGSPMSANL